VLFSGDLETGMGNTDHLGTCWYQFVVHQVKKFGARHPFLLKAFKHPLLKFKVQGDDIATRTPGDFVPFLGITAFRDWLDEKYHMTFKEMEVRTSFFSYLDASQRPKYRVLIPGIKFLKRRFIKYNWRGSTRVAPFREAPDYFVRVGRSTQDQSDPRKCIARCIGLLWDTMGTNPEAENLLIRAVQHCVTCLEVEVDTPAWTDLVAQIREIVATDEYVAGRAHRWSITSEVISESVSGSSGWFVNMAFVRDKFLLRNAAYDHQYESSPDREPTRDHIGLLPELVHFDRPKSERD